MKLWNIFTYRSMVDRLDSREGEKCRIGNKYKSLTDNSASPVAGWQHYAGINQEAHGPPVIPLQRVAQSLHPLCHCNL
jgi:hypothetical protein